MSVADAVKALDAISGDDPERAHSEADEILQAAVYPAVSMAYDRVASRCRWWATA